MTDLDIGIQEHLLALICYEKQHCHTVAGLVPLELYSKFYREIYQVASDFLQRYDQPIGEHLFDEVTRLRALHKEDSDIYARIYTSIFELKGEANADYVLANAGHFMAYQTTKAATAEALEALKKGTPEAVAKVHSIWTKAMQAKVNTMDLGIRLTDKSDLLDFTNPTNAQQIPCGIPELDARLASPFKKRLHLLAGRYGSGKSWWLFQCLKGAMLARKRVLYVSLEMPLVDICKRFIGSYFGFSATTKASQFFEITKDNRGRVLSLEAMKLAAPSYFDAAGVAQLNKLVDVFQRRPMVMFKHWPSNRLTMDRLNSYLDQIQSIYGFIPDELILDYLGICKIVNPRDAVAEVNQITLDFRALADERNFAGVSVAQFNRTGDEKDVASGSDVAGAFSITHHADYLVTLNRTKMEKSLGLSRIWVDKARDTEDNYAVLISSSLARGQFCVSSAMMSEEYSELIKSVGGYDDAGS